MIGLYLDKSCIKTLTKLCACLTFIQPILQHFYSDTVIKASINFQFNKPSIQQKTQTKNYIFVKNTHTHTKGTGRRKTYLGLLVLIMNKDRRQQNEKEIRWCHQLTHWHVCRLTLQFKPTGMFAKQHHLPKQAFYNNFLLLAMSLFCLCSPAGLSSSF